MMEGKRHVKRLQIINNVDMLWLPHVEPASLCMCLVSHGLFLSVEFHVEKEC